MIFSKFGKNGRLVLLFLLISIIALGVSGYFWWQVVYSRPENVFRRMLNNSLSAKSVIKSSVTLGPDQKVVQTSEYYLFPDPKVHGVVKIEQEGEQRSLVTRETLATGKTNFVRLVSVETSQKSTSGQPYDFSSIAGVWGVTPADETNNSTTQLYGQNVAVPFAPLTSSQRRQVLSQINADGVYDVKYNKVTRITSNGRPAYQYKVTVKPEAFIKMMKSVGNFVGAKGFNEVNSDEYKNLPPVDFTFIVDILSGDLMRVEYGTGQAEDYASAGKRNATQAPNSAISMNELQQRLQKLQR